MGYTHYWKTTAPIPDDVWQLICGDAEKIILLSPAKLVWEYDEPNKLPEVKRVKADGGDTCIRFNGVGDDGHETFFFEQHATDFSFCKTAQKPYDVAVCAVLAAIADRTSLVKVSSDGDPSEWEEGLALARQALNRLIDIKLERDV